MSDFLRIPCTEWAEQLVKPMKDLSLPEYEALCAHLDNCTVCTLARMDFQMVERLLRELPAPECLSESSDTLPARLEQFWNEEQEKTEQNNSTTGQVACILPSSLSVDKTTVAVFFGENSLEENSLVLSIDEHKALTAAIKDTPTQKEESFSGELKNADKQEHGKKLCFFAKCGDNGDDTSEFFQIMLSAVLLQENGNCSAQQDKVPLQEGKMPWDSLDALLAWLRPIVGEDASSIEYRKSLRMLLETYEQAKKSDITSCQWHFECKKAPKAAQSKDEKEHLPNIRRQSLR